MDRLLAQLPVLLLVSSRVAGMTAVSPVFANRFILAPTRVALTLLLAMLMLPAAQVAPGATEGAAFLVACVLELVVGLVIGFLSQLVFAVLQMAGAMLDLDMGFSMAQILDPVSGHSDPILGTFFQTLALTLYFLMNGHHWLLRGLADSFTAIPAGGLVGSSLGFQHVVDLFGQFLAFAVQMVLPFIAVMLMATVVLAAVNRAVQQLQILQTGMGLKSLAGLAMMMLLLPQFLTMLDRLFSAGHSELARTLQLMR
jgi:flagellar biosynthetic protein FliR